MFLFMFLWLFSTSHICVNAVFYPEPIVVMPSAIRWNADNDFIVTPVTADSYPLAMEATLVGKTVTNATVVTINSYNVHLHGLARYSFTLSTKNSEPADEYKLIVKLQNHSEYRSNILYGLPDLYFAKIETDKGYYKPGEDVTIRILPLTSNGKIFTDKLKLSLINEYGFQVLATSVTADGGFIQKTLKLPEFIKKQCTWIIVVKPYINTNVAWLKFEKLIKVGHYKMPKIFIAVQAESQPSPTQASLNVEARYPHGKHVKGIIMVKCHGQELHSIHNSKVGFALFVVILGFVS